ncbi:MAG: YigZ family protein [Clostridia bacterium]|nr:YigZ family protein [Clostridia bacterium]
MQNYKTVLREAEAEFTEKRSRFIAQVSPVQSEEEALAFLEKVRTKHREARHNVYAYIVRENNISRFSDDGEPSGTAGLPVLNVLTRQNLTDVCIVVTRYFGGILLGAGGLARAYGKSAADGVAAAGACEMVYSEVFAVTVDYSLLGKVQHVLEEKKIQVLDTVFGAMPTLTVCTESAEKNNLIDTLTNVTGGKLSIAECGARFCPKPITETVE